MSTTGTASRRDALVRCPFCLTLNRVDLARWRDGPTCGGCRRPLLLDRPTRAGDEDFDRIVRETQVPVLVDFHADWCAPCRAMAPALDAFAAARAGDVLVVKVDTDRNHSTAERFGIRGIPTLVVFRGGRDTGRHVGMADQATLAALVGRDEG